MAVIYVSERLYIEDASTLQDLVQRLEAVRLCYIQTMAKGALRGDTEEYRLDDGQTRINVRVRSMEEMSDSLRKIEQTIQIYRNQYNGRSMKMVEFNDVQYLTDTFGL